MSTAPQVVVASTGSTWVVQSSDGSPLSPPLRTQTAAIEVASAILGEGGGGEVLVQARDGSVRRRLDVPAAGPPGPGAERPVAPEAAAAPAVGGGFCPSCGAPGTAGQSFCGACGTRTGGQAAAPAPVTRPAPAWLTADWPAALLLAGGTLLGTLLVCAAYGMVLGGAAGGTKGILAGLVIGCVLPFAAYGGEVLAAAGEEGDNVVLLQDHLPVVLTAGVGALTYLALRWGVGRLRREPARARAFAVKLVAVQAAALTLAGAFADQGDVAGDEDLEGFVVITAVSQVHAGFVALLLGLALAAVALHRAGVAPAALRPPAAASRLTTAAGTGLVAWLLMVVLLGTASLVALAVAVDGTRERTTLLTAAPLLVAGTGVATAAVAHGGATGHAGSGALEGDSEGSDGPRLSDIRERDEHASLVTWALPLSDEDAETPWWAYLLLVVPLATLLSATVLALRRLRPATESRAVADALVLAAGYTTASWALSKAIGLSVAGGGTELDWGFELLVVRPGVGSSLGLPLLWAVVVCALTAFVWARRRQLPGSVLGALAVSAPGGVATTPPPAPPAAPGTARCATCAAPLAPGAGYCGSCGTLVPGAAPTGG